jgi:hypothetical protein
MKDAWLIVMGMFIALGVVGAGIGIFFGLFKPPMDAKKILKNGTETTATIVKLASNVAKTTKTTTGSSTKTVSSRLYYITLSFVNSNGEEIIYKTSSLYPEKFIVEQGIASKSEFTKQYDVIEKETVQVMYRGNKAVLKEFVPDDSEDWFWIVPVVMGLIGIGIFLVCLFAFMNAMTLSKIKKHGTDGTGIYLKHETTTLKDGRKAYNIYFTFENRDGKYVEVKTGYEYEEYEGEALKEMQKFPIKYEDEKAIIVVDKSEFMRFKATKTLQE